MPAGGVREKASKMRLIADLMIFFGAILLTCGTDLVIQTAGQDLASVGGLLGTLLSMIGASLLTAGILNHRGLTRRALEEAANEEDRDSGRVRTDRR
jgi:hypothetical protein